MPTKAQILEGVDATQIPGYHTIDPIAEARSPKGELEEFKGRQIVSGRTPEQVQEDVHAYVRVHTRVDAPGPREITKLQSAGFTDDEVHGWTMQQRKQLSEAGFGQGEIDTYFGQPPFDPAPVKAHVNEAIKAATQPTTEGGQPKPVTNFLDALKAGFGESITGLLTQGKPTTTVAPDAPMSSRIAGQVGTLAGDVPAMIGGYLAGGGPRSPITGTAGAFALPAGMRKILMDKYEKGEVTSWIDYWERFSGAFIDTAKGWITGAATGAVGKAIGLAPIVSPTAKAAATVTGEVATMVTVGKALEGQMPEPHDFVDTAIALGFVKGSARIATKLRGIYAETGVKPDDVAADIMKDPTILHDLMSRNVQIPKAYREAVQISPQVFHGTNQVFEQIDPTKGGGTYGKGAYFTTDPNYASGFARESGANVIPAQVHLAKPLKMAQPADPQLKDHIREALTFQGLSPEDVSQYHRDLDAAKTQGALHRVLMNAFGEEKANRQLQELGYDGLIIKYGTQASDRTDYVAFDRTSVFPNYVTPTVPQIHKMADARGIKWDASPAFMDFTEKITGKRHLDDLTPAERAEMANAVEEWVPDLAMAGGAPNKAVGEAQKAVLDRLVLKDPKTEKMTLSDLYTSVVDNLNPIKQALKTEGKADMATAVNPYSLERLTRGIAGKASEFLNAGAFDFNTYKTKTPGYFKILEPVKNDLDGFRAYMVAKRAVEKAEQGIVTGIPLEQAKTVVREGREKYEAVHQARIKYRNAIIDTLEQSGILGAKAVEAMKEANKDYVPFYRSFEEDGGRATGATRVRDPIKKMEGSERQILDPIISDIKDTFLFVGLAEKNAARQAFVHLGTEFAQKAGVRHMQVLTEVGADGVVEMKPAAFRAEKNELVVFEKGVRNVYTVDPKVAEAFNGLDAGPTTLLAKIAYAPASLLRAGVTITPDFAARNMMRDAISAFIYAGSNPVKTALGLKSMVTKDDAFHNWMKGGGANATMVAIDRDYLGQHLGQINAETGLMRRAWNVAKTPLDILRATSELVENSTRLGAVRSGLQQAQSKAQIQALSLIAREATVDFARHGKDTQAYARSTAFFNPAIQGIDRFAREAKEHPLGMTAKALASVTLPSMLLWYANKDDKEIQDLPRWQKDLFWVTRVPLPDGKSFILRIPKPQEFGIVFGTVPERLLDRYVNENPAALRDIEKTILDAFTPSLIPTAAVPVISQFANRDTFQGRALIPAGQEHLLPEYQYTPYTTETAKAMGQIIGAFPGMEKAAVRSDDPFIGGVARALTTPILLENYLRSWTGGMGMYLFQLADKGLREAGAVPDPVLPASSLADIPFVKAFVVRYPSANAQSIQDFYSDAAVSQKYYDTMMSLAKQGDPRATDLMEKHSEDLAQLGDIRAALTQQSQIVRMIYKNPQFAPDEKRQLIDTLYYRMIELSQAGNAALRELKAGQK